MKKLRILFKELLERELIVYSDRKEELQERAEQLYKNGSIVLDAEDLKEVEIIVEEVKEKENVLQNCQYL